jgi:hypothetical protein
MIIPGYALRDRVIIQHFLRSGSHGDIYDTDHPRRVKAHITARRRMVDNGSGGTVFADATGYISGKEPPVPVDSRVEWPAGSGSWYIVRYAGAVPDEVRPAYRELILEAE